MVDPFRITQIQQKSESEPKLLKNPFKKDDDKKNEIEAPAFVKKSQKNTRPSELNAKATLTLFKKAQELTKNKEYDEAEKILKQLVDDLELNDMGMRKSSITRLFGNEDRTPYYTDVPIREDSLFLLGEIHFEKKEYPKAEEYYSALLKQYPSNKHTSIVTRRLFDIAGDWMDLKITKSEDISQISYSTEGVASDNKLKVNQDIKGNSFINVSDSSKPHFDATGRALKALKTIWMNDPTGPLADDAIMLEASYYVRKGRYIEARESFKLLRQEYPNSPHIKDAYILASHVTQISYKGAQYEDEFLNEARNLKKATLQQFNDLSPQQREMLENEIKILDEATVLREIERARLYMKKGKYNAVELYCNFVLNVYPNSKYTADAKNLLAEAKYHRENPGWTDNIPLLSQNQGPSPWDRPAANSGPDNAPENQPGLKKSDSLPNLKSISLPRFMKPKTEKPDSNNTQPAPQQETEKISEPIT